MDMVGVRNGGSIVDVLSSNICMFTPSCVHMSFACVIYVPSSFDCLGETIAFNLCIINATANSLEQSKLMGREHAKMMPK